MQPWNPIQEPPWTKEAVLTLIEAYRRHECLWNREHPQYLDRFYRALRVKAMNNIYEALDCVYSFERITKKLHNLRAHLNLEVQKVIQRRNQGERYSSSWALFDTLLFMSSKEIPKLPENTTNQTKNISQKPHHCAKQKLHVSQKRLNINIVILIDLGRIHRHDWDFFPGSVILLVGPQSFSLL